MENETRSKNKLAQALQDAAIKNINEDIHEINDTLENITSTLPGKVEAEFQRITDEVIALRKALNAIPEEFDQQFTTKINKVFSISDDIVSNSKKLNNILLTDIPEKIGSLLEKKVRKLHLISTTELLVFGFISVIAGCIFSGIIFWMIFS